MLIVRLRAVDKSLTVCAGMPVVCGELMRGACHYVQQFLCLNPNNPNNPYNSNNANGFNNSYNPNNPNNPNNSNNTHDSNQCYVQVP